MFKINLLAIFIFPLMFLLKKIKNYKKAILLYFIVVNLLIYKKTKYVSDLLIFPIIYFILILSYASGELNGLINILFRNKLCSQ